MNNQMQSDSDEMVFFMTNAQPMNEVVAHRRTQAGALQSMGAYPTGGAGAGKGPEAPYHDPLGSQSALAVDRERKLLFAVNACSDTVSTFRIEADGLTLVGQAAAGGNFPVSLARYGDLLYVLNAGGDASINGYAIGMDGKLSPIKSSTRILGVGGKEPPDVFSAPGQIDFSPDGRWLIVIEKGIKHEDLSTHRIHVFAMHGDKPAAMSATTPSRGWLPFSSAFSKEGKLLVVEAFGKGPIMAAPGAVTAYDIMMDGSLKPITISADTHQKESCWVAVAGDYAYVTNFASHSITGFKVMADGSLRELSMDGVTAMTGDGSFPIDMAVSRDGQRLYALLPGARSLAAYRIGMNGELKAASMATGDWPVGVQGLAVY